MPVLPVIPAALLLGLLIVSSLTTHYYYGPDGDLLWAWHLDVPGFITSGSPEHTVDLRRWVGSQYGPLRGVSTEDGTEIPEVTAGLALKALGLYKNYEFREEPDGHWVLYKPEQTRQHFSLRGTSIRISPGYKVGR